MISDARLVTRAPGRVFLAAAWYLAFAVAAFMAVGVELDRQGRFDLRVAEMVPEPFQGDALENLTKHALESNDNSQGEALARKLVERRPIPAESLSLYSNGLLVNGNERAGLAALQAAAGRGWRDRFVQRAVIISALQQGTPQIAADRVVGLWRLGERSEWLKDLTRATLEAPGGFAALESTLIEPDRHLGTDFLAWAAASLRFVMVERLAERMAANHSDFDCRKFSAQTDLLVSNGRGIAAAAVWNALCASGRRSPPNDLAFEAVDILPGPFDWRYPETAGVDVDFRDDGALHYSSSDPLLRVVARRYLALARDRYLLKIGRQAAFSGAKLRMVCIGSSGSKAQVKLDTVVDEEWSFVVPWACPIQELSISVRQGSGDIGNIHLLQAQE